MTSPPIRPTAPAAEAPVLALDERVIGIRVLRVLHSTERRRILVVHDERGMPQVVKHWLRHDPDADRELRALDRARGAHVVRLLDVGDEGDGIAALLERAERGDLARLLRERTSFSPGELVTIAAPLATTVARMHRAGVAHGRLSAQRLLFDGSGAPQLSGFGGAELFEPELPPAHLERVDGVRRDRDAVSALTRALAERVTGGAGRRALEAVERAADDRDDPLGRLSEELFAFSPGSPVRFPVGESIDGLADSATPDISSTTVAQALARTSTIGRPRPRSRHEAIPASVSAVSSQRRARRPERAERAAASGASGRRGVEHGRDIDRRGEAAAPRRAGRGSPRHPGRSWRDAMLTLLDGAPFAAARARAVQAVASKSAGRRKTLAAVGSAAAAALLAFLLVPGPSAAETRGSASSTERAGVHQGAGSRESQQSTHPPDDAGAGRSRGDAAPLPTSDADSERVEDSADADELDAVRGDDPLAAARTLLATRRDSLRELDQAGLARVVDAGSTAAADDRALLERLDAGTATAADRARVELSAAEVGEQLGDAVVIRLSPDSDPASLLIIRGEAGWRIRAYSSAAG